MNLIARWRKRRALKRRLRKTILEWLEARDAGYAYLAKALERDVGEAFWEYRVFADPAFLERFNEICARALAEVERQGFLDIT